MDYSFSKEHQLFRRMMRDFAENEVKPIAGEIDEHYRFPRETLAKLKSRGLTGIAYPTRDGGSGGDITALAIAIEEVSRVCGSSGLLISTHNTLGTYPIYHYGSDGLKERHLRRMLDGTAMGGFALTESPSGSDSNELQTRAVLDGDDYVLNGTKTYCTGVGLVDYYTALVMTDKDKGIRGISAVLVEKDAPGLRVGRIDRKMGLHGSVSGELIFDNCRIPKDNLLGKPGGGFKIAMEGLNSARVGIGAMALGICQGAIDETVRFVRRRSQFGATIASYQNTQYVLADLQTRVDAGRHLVYHAAWLADSGKPYMQEAAKAKYYNSHLSWEVCNKCLQFFGGYGYLGDYPIERMLRDAKMTELGEGTSEILRMIIGRGMGVA